MQEKVAGQDGSKKMIVAEAAAAPEVAVATGVEADKIFYLHQEADSIRVSLLLFGAHAKHYSEKRIIFIQS